MADDIRTRLAPGLARAVAVSVDVRNRVLGGRDMLCARPLDGLWNRLGLVRCFGCCDLKAESETMVCDITDDDHEPWYVMMCKPCGEGMDAKVRAEERAKEYVCRHLARQAFSDPSPCRQEAAYQILRALTGPKAAGAARKLAD